MKAKIISLNLNKEDLDKIADMVLEKRRTEIGKVASYQDKIRIKQSQKELKRDFVRLEYKVDFLNKKLLSYESVFKWLEKYLMNTSYINKKDLIKQINKTVKIYNEMYGAIKWE